MSTTVNPNNSELNMKKGIIRRLNQVVFQYLILAAILFISAGRLDWPAAWIFLVVAFGVLVFNVLVLVPKNPELVAERGRVKENTKGWDRVITKTILIFTLIGLVMAGLDKRFAWSAPLPVWVHLLGMVFYALSQLLLTWSMLANQYFSTTVRIQDERDHAVADSGPYQYVRHPGYVGLMTSMVATPFALGTLWMFIPYSLGLIGYVIRTALEDRTLQSELEGYSEFAQRVRYRLVPGIW
jgi:protein-S-isoprenylcysteine O-methyltransferase Ste14